jgi:hypothetical protein
MKIWVGEIVKNEVNRSGKKKTQIAKEIPLSRTHLDNILNDDYMELEYLIKIGKVIRHDFTEQLPEASKHIVGEPEVAYETLNSSQLKNELLEMQRKYTVLQDDYIKALKDLLDCRALVTAK